MASYRSLLDSDLRGWRMAGPGGFRWAGPGVLESFGGSGLLWYADEAFADFILQVEWRVTAPEDNSGVFLRCPPLQDEARPAIEHGYEVQIDERGLDPAAGRLGSPLHLTGAIYRLAPARPGLSWPVGAWNLFEIIAGGPCIEVRLNGAEASRLDNGSRRLAGHVALQNHHEGSAVQFRRLDIIPLPRTTESPGGQA